MQRCRASLWPPTCESTRCRLADRQCRLFQPEVLQSRPRIRLYTSTVRPSWPLICRSEELRRVDAALMTEFSGVVISGSAGVGKSRLALEALTAAQARGCQTRLITGTHSGRAIPLGAFSSWTAAEVPDSVHLLTGVIDAVTHAPPSTEVVIVVDDVHLLDDLSAYVVNQIMQRNAAKLVLTLLDDAPTSAAVREIWKMGQFERLELEPLSAEQTSVLLSTALGADIDKGAASRLWDLTRGNPLYLRHIIEQEIADGRMKRHRGEVWQWVEEPVVPTSLVELIQSRIGTLPASVSDVIDTLSVSEPIELSVLARITDQRAIEDAETSGLVVVVSTDRGMAVRLAHPLYGEVRRRCAPATKLRRLRGLVAGELDASGAGDDAHILVRRATLGLESDRPPDEKLLTKAAQSAVWLADLALAERLSEAAVRSGGGLEAELTRAHALSWLGRGDEAEAALARIDPSVLQSDGRARVGFLRSSNMLWSRGDPATAKAVIEEAAENVSAQHRAYIDTFRAVYWFAVDEPEAALRASSGLAVDDMPAVVGAELAWVLATVYAEAGQTPEAVSAAENGYVTATRSFDAPHMMFNIADSHVSALVLAGRVNEALDVGTRIRQQAADFTGTARPLGAAVAGRAAIAAGDLRSACALLQDSVTLLCAKHSLGWGYRYLIPRIEALAVRGSLSEATADLALLEHMPRPFRQLDHEQSRARAWVAAAEGAVNEGINLLLSAARRASAKGQFAAEVLCLQTAIQFGYRGAASRLQELETRVDGPRVQLVARFAEALRDMDVGALAQLSGEFELMGDLVAAADTAAYASLGFRRAGKRGSALSCATRASELAERTGASTPALLGVLEPLPLTVREREIATLIGQGMSSRRIAERLHLSVRTVESHTYRAMSKTGTTSRNELAALLPHQRA